MDKIKEKVATECVEKELVSLIKSNPERRWVFGIGSGSTLVYVIEIIGKLLKEKKIQNFVCVPTSLQSFFLCQEHGLPLTSLTQEPSIDLTIDGADEVDQHLNLIKGGGGCHVQEKLVAINSDKLVIVIDHTKKSTFLGQNWKKGIPLEVLPSAITAVQKHISKKHPNCKINLRSGSPSKAGPAISDNGNLLLDIDFGEIKEVELLATELKLISGVVDTGLFPKMTQKVYVGEADGLVTLLTPS